MSPTNKPRTKLAAKLRDQSFDVDRDGKVTETEVEVAKKIRDQKKNEQKLDSQRRMAWTALITVIVLSAALFLPIFPDSRIQAMGDLIGLFYVSMAGIVGTFMGATAWLSRYSNNDGDGHDIPRHRRP